MTFIKYTHDRSSYTLTVDGHSGFAERGQDIVCSAVSALTYSLIRALEASKQKGKTDGLCIIYGVAHMEISFVCPDEEYADALLSCALCGYKLLYENYPANVKFVEGFSI